MSYQLSLPRRVERSIREAGIPKSKLLKVLEQYVSKHSNRVIDSQPALNGERRTQENWIPYFNALGKRMISAPDVYRAVSAQREVLDSLRVDFAIRWLVSSTRIVYAPNHLAVTIVHNFGSTVVEPTERRVIVPVYDGTYLTAALKSEETVAYLRTLFDTKDKPARIAETLEHLSQKTPDKILLWTPNQASRREGLEGAVRFLYDYGRFRVGGDGFDVNGGHSRGLSASPRSGRKK